MTDHTDLLARLAAMADEEDPERPAPLPTADIRRAEDALGFVLAPLLASVYRKVGNGGFGPDYHLLPLIGEAGSPTAVGRYLDNRTSGGGTVWAWPEGILPILDWGCGMFACVDCRTQAGPVLLFEPNPGDPDLAWYVDSPDLATWLEHCVNDTGWWTQAEDGEDVDLHPWPRT
jgi:hypothetical protein